MPLHGPPLAPPIDLNRLLATGLERDPAAAALQDLDRSIGWAELDRRVDQLARAYQRLGLQRGERLASLIPNRVDLAGLRSGLVLTPLNYRYLPREIDHALTVSGAAALVFHGERLADVQASAVAGQLPRGCHRIDDLAGFDDLLADAPADAPVDNDAPPWPELAAGASAAIASRIDAPTVETLLRRHRPAVLLMLPAALFVLVRDERLQPTDLSSVRLCISGGDKVPHQLQEEFRAAAGFLHRRMLRHERDRHRHPVAAIRPEPDRFRGPALSGLQRQPAPRERHRGGRRRGRTPLDSGAVADGGVLGQPQGHCRDPRGRLARHRR